MRFATVYNVALQAAKNGDCMCWLSRRRRWAPQDCFEVVKLAIGKAVDPYSDYFGRCRRERNVIEYDDAFVATETEAVEIVTKATKFADRVERWIAKTDPSLNALGGRLLADGGTQICFAGPSLPKLLTIKGSAL
jgi:hypothetical protein